MIHTGKMETSWVAGRHFVINSEMFRSLPIQHRIAGKERKETLLERISKLEEGNKELRKLMEEVLAILKRLSKQEEKGGMRKVEVKKR
jgi:hypothetical protein